MKIDPIIFLPCLKQTIIAKLFSFHGCHSDHPVAIATMHHSSNNVCEKAILNFLNFELCLNIKILKKCVFCTPYLVKYIPSISVTEKPLAAFSTIKKNCPKVHPVDFWYVVLH